jgi:tRNA nucleotidyltransferase (CCA-adding enzyme)
MRLFEALLKSEKPSVYLRALLASGELSEDLPELAACVGVPQNPVYHPEGDVFEHTMLVVDCAAALRDEARNPLGFMLSALTHDLGKAAATETRADGKVTAYGHEVLGRSLCRALMGRLTDDGTLIDYVENMMWLHMRPNVLAKCRSKKKKTRQLFDLSLCPEDLILLSRADASGKLDAPYDETLEAFLRQRLEDYRRVAILPMVNRADLLAAGFAPGEALDQALARARQLHFSGFTPEKALEQVLAEAKCRTRS